MTRINLTKSQLKMLSDFSSNFSIAWLAFALISGPEISTKTLGAIINGVGLFMISFLLSREI